MNDDHTWKNKPRNVSFATYVKSVYANRSWRPEEFDLLVKVYGLEKIEKILSTPNEKPVVSDSFV